MEACKPAASLGATLVNKWLNADHIAILKYFYTERAFSEKHSVSLKALERDLGRRIVDLENKLDEMVGWGFLGCKKKKTKHYYASIGDAIRALQEHGFEIWRGGRGRLP
jgi:hypothetical protein